MKVATTPFAINYLVQHGEVKMISDYIAKLEAENERLRKAGDALIEVIDQDEVKGRREFLGEHGFDPVKAWLAAKGVQS